MTCICYLTVVKFELVKSPEVTLCGARGYNPVNNPLDDAVVFTYIYIFLTIALIYIYMQLVFPPNDAVVFAQIMSATALIYMQHVFPLNDAVNNLNGLCSNPRQLEFRPKLYECPRLPFHRE